MMGSEKCEVLFKPINEVADNTEFLAAVAGKRIRCVGLFLIVDAAETVQFASGAVPNAITGNMSFAANGGCVLPPNSYGYFETATGEKLQLLLGATNGVRGSMAYIRYTP